MSTSPSAESRAGETKSRSWRQQQTAADLAYGDQSQKRWHAQTVAVRSAYAEIQLLRRSNDELRLKADSRAEEKAMERESTRQRPSTSCGSPTRRSASSGRRKTLTRSTSLRQYSPPRKVLGHSAQHKRHLPVSQSFVVAPGRDRLSSPYNHTKSAVDDSGTAGLRKFHNSKLKDNTNAMRRIRSEMPQHTASPGVIDGRSTGFDPQDPSIIRTVMRRELGDDDDDEVVVEVVNPDASAMSSSMFELANDAPRTTQIVDLAQRGIGLREIKQIIQRLAQAKYTELHINDNRINAMAAELLFQHLHPDCRVVDMGGNAIGASGFASLSHQVLGQPSKFSNLITLSLRATGLTDAGMLEMCDGLHRATQLQRLNLSQNYITGIGVDALVLALRAEEHAEAEPLRPSLKRPASNHFGPSGTHTSHVWRALWELDLSFNKCGVSVVPLLTAGDGLPELVDMNLAGCRLGAAFSAAPFAFEGFLAAIASNHSLQHLNLALNDFTDRDTRRLAIALVNNKTLLGLHLEASQRGYMDSCGYLLTPPQLNSSADKKSGAKPKASKARTGGSRRRPSSTDVVDAAIESLADQLPGESDVSCCTCIR